MIKRSFIAASILVSTAFSLSAQTEIKNIKKHITFLASDKLKGRGTSSEGEEKAAQYIADYFKKLKLEPMGSITTNGQRYKVAIPSYFFDFTFKKNPNPHDTNTANIVERKGKNVVAFLNNGAAHTIVIGAHFDHLGLGHDYNSLDANPEGKIHNGADDNASGTAGVLELARYYSTNNVKEKYNFLFMTFSGEELGLLGSKKWCDNPTYPLEKINYMVNMDMVGRLNDSTKKLIIYGVGTAPEFVDLIDKTNYLGQKFPTGDSFESRTIFSIKKDSAGIGPSDQTSFYLKDIPVLHFFTGQHSDYHKPSDDADKINYPGEKMVLDYITQFVTATEALPKLKFTATKTQETKSTKFKVTLGVMPDYAYEGKGMRIDGVSNGKPAAKAGLEKGDIVTKLGETVVDNMESYMKALSVYQKGDKATVKVLRKDKEQEFEVEF
ncbi:MAG: M28 family peptidase [Bacteroidota bacterium]|nr:M28 family peptidase [Bacteroidota bacterium]